MTALQAIDRRAERELLSIRDGYTNATKVMLRWFTDSGNVFDVTGIRAWQSYLRQENGGRILSANTRNFYLRTLKSRVRWMLAHSRMPAESKQVLEVALSEVKYDSSARRPAKYFTTEEVQQLVQHASEHNPRLSLLIEFMAEQGTRVSETLSILASDVHPQGNGHAEVVVHGKGDTHHKVRDRVLHVDEEMLRRIRKQFNGGVFLFSWGPRQGRYTRSYVSMYIHRLSGRLFGKAKGAHTLRHSWFTRELQDHPGDLVSISKYGGHATTQVTLSTYMHGGWTAAEAAVKLPHYAPKGATA